MMENCALAIFAKYLRNCKIIYLVAAMYIFSFISNFTNTIVSLQR